MLFTGLGRSVLRKTVPSVSSTARGLSRNWTQKGWPYSWGELLYIFQYFVRHGLTSSGNVYNWEKTRWRHVASPSLPAVSHTKNFPGTHIMTPVLTMLVQSRWRDIGLVFLRVYEPRLHLGHKHAKKKNELIMQPSWPHTWSIQGLQRRF